ncbi:MAG: NUDIX hydrolase [Ignavibacteriaceae bacterium]|nr:NUDIX hydrolase [Ignavibacteriaceae bacterium]
MEPKWLEWAKSLQAIAQNGLTYALNEFDIERYEQIKNISAEMMATNSDGDLEFIKGLFNNVDGYATPKVDVRGVVFKDGKILLVKEKADGGWTLPGGWADPNETPSESVEREVLEESGFIVKTQKVLAVYDRAKQGHKPPFPFHVFKLFFLCDLKGGISTLSNETDGVDFFEENNIPDVLSKSRVLKSQIERFFEFYKNPNLPTDFD